MPATTLVPGYRQVESFGPDEEYLEEEEEVSYVTLDLGVVEPTLLPSTSTYRLIVSVGPVIHGTDDNERRVWIRQRLSYNSQARYSRAAMTRFSARSSYLRKKKVRAHRRLCLDAERTRGADDTHPNKRSLVHVGSTEQRIRFKEVQLKEKARPEPPPPERKSPDLFEQVATIYADPEPDRTASLAPSSGELEQPGGQGGTGSGSPRKKKGSRKGKERAVDVNGEDVMDMT